MDKMVPLITVVMPVYNAGRHLRAAVLSIVRQTYTSWELLIIDDGSTDDAFTSISDIHDARIRVLRDGENRGLACRLNEGIDMAKGDYFARMDQDDIAYPERLSKQFETLRKKSDLDLLATRCITISQENEPVGLLPYAATHEEICAHPWRGFYMPHPTWMGKIEWFRKYRYTIPEPHLCEDQDLLTRSYENSCFSVVPEILLAYRISRKKSLKKLFRTRYSLLRMQMRNYIQSHHPGFFFLALALFIVRIMLDILNSALPENYQKGRHRSQYIDGTDLKKWQQVWDNLGD